MDAGDVLDDPVVFLWFFHRPADVGSRSPSVKGAHKTDPGTNAGPQSKVSKRNPPPLAWLDVYGHQLWGCRLRCLVVINEFVCRQVSQNKADKKPGEFETCRRRPPCFCRHIAATFCSVDPH